MSSACHLPSGRSRSDSFSIRTLEQSTEAVKKYNPQMRPLVSKVLLPFLARQLSNHAFFCFSLASWEDTPAADADALDSQTKR